MATNQTINNFQFNWGETVRISATAPPAFRPRELASVCGIRVVKPDKGAKFIGAPTETILYLVEFGDGYTVEIHEKFLLEATSE